MIEKTIKIQSVDPLILYGPNNQNLELIKRFFPHVKLIARGDELKIRGSADQIAGFDQKMAKIFDHVAHYNYLTISDLEDLLLDNGATTNQAGNNEDVLVFGTGGKPIRSRTFHQREAVALYKTHDLLIATGPAGSGKTYIAVTLAVRALRNKEVKRIILSRPAVESGEHLGFLPGDLREKLDPYLQPLYDALLDMIPAKKLQEFMEQNIIQIAPLAFMRGRTLENSFVILDEAQNASINQLKMFLTRMGAHSKFIVTGDLTQIDLPDKNRSGLLHASEILKNIEGIAIVPFDRNDIIRHQLVEKIVRAYDEDKNEPSNNEND